MHTWPEIAAAVQRTLASIPELEFYDVVPAAFTTPCAILEPESCDWTATMGKGRVRYEAKLTVLVSLSEPRDAQERIHALLAHHGERSIPQLLLDTPGLNLTDSAGNATTDCHATGWSGFGPITVADVDYLSAEIPLVIHTKGNAA